MSQSAERRDALRNQWPFTRTGSVTEWVRAGSRFFESAYHIFLRNEELTPETLRGVSEYADFIHRPDIHPLVYIKPDVLDRLKGAQTIFIAFMAPSAGGKDTILKTALPRLSGFATKIITHTTRNPREDGSDKGNYRFISIEEFERLIESGEFAEYLPIGEQGEHYYGTTWTDIEDAMREGRRFVIWRGEFVGWKELKHRMRREYPDIPCVSVFTLPKAPLRKLMEWIEGKRGRDPKERWRTEKAKMEVIAGGSADIFIVNPIEEGGVPTQAAEAFVDLLTHINGEK